MNFAGGKRTITSLCPTIGKTYAVLYSGHCPNQLRNPYGKELNISFIGPKPYISYNPMGEVILKLQIFLQKNLDSFQNLCQREAMILSGVMFQHMVCCIGCAE